MTGTSPLTSPLPTNLPFQFVYSSDFAALLQSLGASLAVTTYQAGKLMLVRADGGKLSLLLRSCERPMGLCLDPRRERMFVGTRRMVWTLRNEPSIAPQMEPAGRHDGCFVPRRAHVTGDIRCHEIAFVNGSLWVVNTLLSCLCTLDDEQFGFVPRWRPSFIDRIAAEDRCHLNGLAADGNQVRFVTALGATNAADGWKSGKVGGGVLIDVATGATVARGFCMPHSPRCHAGRVFVLDSGRGHLCVVDPTNGKTDVVAALPGYARGLALVGRFAFVGLSRIREQHVFGGLPITERLDESQRQCAIHAVDLQTGKFAGCLQFTEGCAELFDIQVLAGLRWPTVVGFQDTTLDAILVAPPETWKPDATFAMPFSSGTSAQTPTTPVSCGGCAGTGRSVSGRIEVSANV